MLSISQLFVSIKKADNPIPQNVALSEYKQSLKVGDIITAQSFDTQYHTYKIRLDEDGALRVVTEGAKTCLYSSVSLASDIDTLQLTQDESNALILTYLATQTKDGNGGSVANTPSILVSRNNLPYKVTIYLKQGISLKEAPRAKSMVLCNAPYIQDSRVVGDSDTATAKGKVAKWRAENKGLIDDSDNLLEGKKLISAYPRMAIELPKRANFTASVSLAGAGGEIIKE